MKPPPELRRRSGEREEEVEVRAWEDDEPRE
jgi:hypothetical protein